MSKRTKQPIIVFRTTKEHMKTCQDRYKAQPPLHCRSHHHYARKQFEDLMSGRAKLVYDNPDDALRDCERSIGGADSNRGG
jgi:hypothetical protein